MRRGEVWWGELPEPIGRRPVLLLTRDEGIRVRANVTIAPITTSIRGIPTEVRLGQDDGLPRQCAVDLDSVLTVPKARLARYHTVLSTAKLLEVEEALRFALSL